MLETAQNQRPTTCQPRDIHIQPSASFIPTLSKSPASRPINKSFMLNIPNQARLTPSSKSKKKYDPTGAQSLDLFGTTLIWRGIEQLTGFWLGGLAAFGLRVESLMIFQ